MVVFENGENFHGKKYDTICNRSIIDSLYECFYTHEDTLEDIFPDPSFRGIKVIKLRTPYRITFYSKTQKNEFHFNKGDHLRYYDWNNECNVLKNAVFGNVIINKYFHKK